MALPSEFEEIEIDKPVDWLLFFKTNNDFSYVDIIFKKSNSDKMYMRISEMVDDKNILEIEKHIINLINLYASIREPVYMVTDKQNNIKHMLEKSMPRLFSRVHQIL